VDPCQQFARAERLGDVVVRTALEPGNLVLFFRTSGQHDHRQVLRVAVALHSSGELEAALVGQHPVHQQEIGPMISNTFARRRAVLGFAHVETGAAETKGDHVADRFLILNDQNLLACHDYHSASLRLQQNYR